MKAISRLRILLGILQSSHYDMALFRAWLERHPAPRDWDAFGASVAVEWSLKARILFCSSITISRVLPYALRVSIFFLRPLEWMATRWICAMSARRLRGREFSAVIGITGSFGKTTTKEVVAAVLGSACRVERTPENVNTLLGVARWIMRTSFADGDVVVVEMGAYRSGDVARLSLLVRPTIGIITGINEAHRERFGSLTATAAAKCELFDALAPGGIGFWNADSPPLADAVRERRAHWEAGGRTLVSYGRGGSADFGIVCAPEGETDMAVEIIPDEPRPRPKGRGIRAGFFGKESAPPTQSIISPPSSPPQGAGFSEANSDKEPELEIRETIHFFGAHIALPLSAAVLCARRVGLSWQEIRRGIKTIRPYDRRLNPMLLPGNRLVIDDSYNSTLTGARAGIEAVRRIQRRKIGVFAGIPEAGRESERVNEELGRMIAGAFDVILLRRTPVYGAVRRGIAAAGFPEARVIAYSENQEMETLLAGVAQDGDCIYLSAYDWPPIYF